MTPLQEAVVQFLARVAETHVKETTELNETMNRMDKEIATLKKEVEVGRKLWANAQRARNQKAIENDNLRQIISELREENAKLLALTRRGNPRKPDPAPFEHFYWWTYRL